MDFNLTEKRVLRGLLLIEIERLCKKSNYMPHGLNSEEDVIYTTCLDLYRRLEI